MAITFVGVGAWDNGDGTVNPGNVSGVLTGDLLLIAGAQSDDGGSEAFNTPTGFTLIDSIHNGSNHGCSLWGRIATADSETIPAVTTTGGGSGDEFCAQACAFRGTFNTVAGAIAHSSKATYGTGDTTPDEINHPALTITTDDTAVVVLGTKRAFWTSANVLATDALSWAEIGEGSTSSSDDVGSVWDYVIQTTATSISAGNFVLVSGLEDTGASIVVSIKPAAAGGTKTASGTPATEEVTSTGITNVLFGVEAMPSIEALTASGTAVVRHIATGSPSLEELDVTALTTVSPPAGVLAIGSPQIEALTASGIVNRSYAVTGSPEIAGLTSSGFALVTPRLQPILPVYTPSFRSIDAKSIADQYNRGMPLDADYEMSGGRKFYQNGT